MKTFFSNNVQVKFNWLENFLYRNLWKKTKVGLCKKNLNFFWPGILKSAFEVWNTDLLKTKNVYIANYFGA